MSTLCTEIRVNKNNLLAAILKQLLGFPFSAIYLPQEACAQAKFKKFKILTAQHKDNGYRSYAPANWQNGPDQLSYNEKKCIIYLILLESFAC